MPPSPSLLGLPSDILGHVCAALCPHCTRPATAAASCDRRGIRALASLSRTCKALRDVAQPVLSHDLNPRSHIRLIRTLLARPDLAACARTLCNDGCLADLRDDDHPILEAAAARLGIALPEGWELEPDDNADAVQSRVFDVLLALVPGLDTLGYTRYMNLTPTELLVGSDTALPSLRRLHVSYWDTEGGFDLGECRELLRLAPSLEYLGARMCYAVRPGLALANVRALHLQYSYLGVQDLQDAVRACPLLEEFSYKSGGSAVSQYTDGRAEFVPAEAMRELETRKATLRRLDLDFDSGCGEYLHFFDSHVEADHAMGSLAGFPLLEMLLVPPEYFFGEDEWESSDMVEDLIEMLPPSLRFLGLHGKLDPFPSPEGLAEAIGRGVFPNLAKVVLKCSEGDTERVKELFDAVGVEYEPYDSGSHDLPRGIYL